LSDDSAPEYAILKFGWRGRLPKLPRPVIAIGNQTLWRVLVHGTGFKVETDPGQPALVGFYATYFVAADSVREASRTAELVARNRWSSSGAGARAKGDLEVTIEEIDRINGRFRWRSGFGYAFYTEESADVP